MPYSNLKGGAELEAAYRALAARFRVAIAEQERSARHRAAL